MFEIGSILIRNHETETMLDFFLIEVKLVTSGYVYSLFGQE